MTLNFKYGFIYEGFTYGWNENELYRLPSDSSNNKHYGLKKLSRIKVGCGLGYRIKKQKFSLFQLKNMTVLIGKKVQVINDTKDVPVIQTTVKQK